MEANAVNPHPSPELNSGIQVKDREEGLYKQREVKIMAGKPTETADLHLLELTDSKLTTGDLEWDQTMPSAFRKQVCILGCLWDPWQWD